MAAPPAIAGLSRRQIDRSGERLRVGAADGGRLKCLESIAGTLERDSRMRLSRMQDIPGCRLIAQDKAEQDEICA